MHKKYHQIKIQGNSKESFATKMTFVSFLGIIVILIYLILATLC